MTLGFKWGKIEEKDTLYNSDFRIYLSLDGPLLVFWLCWVLLVASSSYINLQLPPPSPHTPSVPHVFLAGSLYCSQPHCNVSLTPSLCTGRQDCLFLCPAVLSSPLLHHYPALIASDHQYVAAADVSLLNLRREHNQPHLLQFLLSTTNSPLHHHQKKITSALP